ncbi:hypothetical protein BKA61DRAFT_71816 [Leptodontidium sp. MPI-SDFR-AT-0119]|nr:hypothetical protein BKA61DRAFT_71816 [Leptodontidium sp. MPI-SDFR-AT-0119]
MPNQASNDQPPPKKRGRPLKDPSGPSKEVQRARVRRAQNAFRNRKEQHVAQLEEKCKTLETVVEEMMNTFIGFSDGLLAGGDVDVHVKQALRRVMERFLELGRRAAREPGEEERAGDEERDDQDREVEIRGSDEGRDVDVQDIARTSRSEFDPVAPIGSQNQDFGIFNTSSYPLSQPAASSTALPNQQVITHSISPHQNPTPNANPYLNNIWTHPPPSPSDASAIPYILAGRDSFAARLYFSIISSAVHSLRGSQPHTLASSIFRYKARYVPQLQIQSVVDGVLNMLLHGTSQAIRADGGALSSGMGPRPGDGEWDGGVDEKRVKRAILREVEEGGEREEEFLGSWGVERYLRSKWRLVVDSRSVRVGGRVVGYGGDEDLGFGSTRGGLLEGGRGEEGAIMGAPTMIPGFTHSSQIIWDAGRLVERLLDVAVTIGEGPRWHYKKIDMVVEAFLVENASRT